MKSATMLLIGSLVLITSCGTSPEKTTTTAPSSTPSTPGADEGRLQQPMAVPADNPITPEKVELGKQLFFDKRLSKTGNMSCETCHMPEKGWADGKALYFASDRAGGFGKADLYVATRLRTGRLGAER